MYMALLKCLLEMMDDELRVAEIKATVADSCQALLRVCMCTCSTFVIKQHGPYYIRDLWYKDSVKAAHVRSDRLYVGYSRNGIAVKKFRAILKSEIDRLSISHARAYRNMICVHNCLLFA